MDDGSKLNIDVPQDLFGLIHGMSGPEKRYFALSSSTKSSGIPQYFQLYQLIRDHSIMTDEELYEIPSLPDFIKGRNLAVEKKRLLDNLLVALRRFHTVQTPAFTRKNELANVQILEARGKSILAKARIRVLKKKAHEAADWPVLLEILITENRLEKVTSTSFSGDVLFAISRERDETMENLRLSFIMRDIWDLLIQAKWSADSSIVKTNIEKAEQLLAANSDTSTIHWLNLLYFHNNLGLLNVLCGDLPTAENHYRILLEIVSRNETWGKENTRSVLLHYYNSLNVFHRNQSYSGFQAMLEKIESLEKQLIPTGENQLRYSSFLKANWLANTGRLEEALLEATQNRINYHNVSADAPPSNYLANAFNFFLIQFLNGKFQEAHQTMETYLNEGYIRLRNDLREALFLFEIAIQFEIGNDDIAANKIEALSRRKIKSNSIHKPFTSLLSLIRSLLFPSANDGYNLEQIQTSLAKLRKSGPLHELNGHQELCFWIESRLREKPILDIAKSYLTKSDFKEY